MYILLLEPLFLKKYPFQRSTVAVVIMEMLSSITMSTHWKLIRYLLASIRLLIELQILIKMT